MSSSSSPPDWSKVHFPVECARCGHDLFGRDEPTCPACNLEFDWSDAVPLDQLKCNECGYALMGLTEPRCPECGTAFSWTEVVEALTRHGDRPKIRRRLPHTFSHMFKVWFSAVRPERFWKTLKTHDQQSVAVLIRGAVGALLFVLAIDFVYAVVEDMVVNRHKLTRRSYPIISFIMLLCEGIENTAYAWERAWAGFWLAVWEGAALIAMLMYRQSIRQIQLKSQHIVTVWAYSVGLLGPTYLLAFYILLSLSDFFAPIPRGPTIGTPRAVLMSGVATTLLCALFIAHALWSIRCGCGHYLKIRHGFGVALATFAVASVATSVIYVRLW